MIHSIVTWLCQKFCAMSLDTAPRPMERDRQRRVDEAVTDAERARLRARRATLEAQATVMEGRRRMEALREYDG